MPKRYYLDTSTWRDYYEDRYGQGGRPLGRYASDVFVSSIKNGHVLLYSDLVVRELKRDYDENDINNMFRVLFLSGVLEKVPMSQKQYVEAKDLVNDRDVPRADALHAVLARDNDAILISQDKHFQLLKDIVKVKKPEEV